MPGGILFEHDWDRLRDSVRHVASRSEGEPLNFVEIGVDAGLTSRDLMDTILSWTNHFTYYGIDLRPAPEAVAEFPQYRHIQALSREAFGAVPGKLNWVLVDGCHCAQCVAWDAVHYGLSLVSGGLMVFHDASPLTQGLDPQTYGELEGIHDQAEAAKGIQVRKFLDGGLPDWLSLASPTPHQSRGGVEIYERF